MSVKLRVFKLLITVAGFKGGIGKTTTAVHLACYFSKLGDTLLVDGDPNRSATGWSKRGAFPFKVVDLMQAALYSPKYEHIVIDTAARPDEAELQALADGCNLLVLPTTPDALAIDALLQTVDLLQDKIRDRYRILLTMVHPKPVKMAEQARVALSELPLFDTEIRRLIAYEKASLMGVPVYQVKDRMAKIAWSDYEQVGKEITS
ncbi:MAG: ParA family protein [Xenococcaceae cyanobacterium MO_234.B1]|nr:ParA family protein [Xenococcaceae cyanobacterium MO_234.B1]